MRSEGSSVQNQLCVLSALCCCASRRVALCSPLASPLPVALCALSLWRSAL
jgi:hypothetical protein